MGDHRRPFDRPVAASLALGYRIGGRYVRPGGRRVRGCQVVMRRLDEDANTCYGVEHRSRGAR